MVFAVLRTAARLGAVALAAALTGGTPALAADPDGEPWVRHTVDSSISGADGVRLGDVNADGLPDITTGWEEDGRIRVYTNPGLAGVRDPWPATQVGLAPSAEDAVFADLDGDGDTDYVVPNIVTGTGGVRDSGQLTWIENVWDGAGPPSAESGDFVEHELPWPGNVGRAKAAAFGDLDLDGRLDVALTFEQADQGREGLVWLRQKGASTHRVWQVRRLSGVDGVKHDDATLVDIDRDGDLDVFTTEERLPRPGLPTGLGVIWYENPVRRGGVPRAEAAAGLRRMSSR